MAERAQSRLHHFDEVVECATPTTELPFRRLAVVFVVEGHVDVADGGQPAVVERMGGFVAGLRTDPLRVRWSKARSGIQVNLPPLGVRQIFGVPATELAERVTPIADLPGAGLRELEDRLGYARNAAARASILAAFLDDAGSGEEGIDDDVEAAWRLLEANATKGIRVTTLPGHLGTGRDGFFRRFREQVGLTAKQAQRVIRFDETVRCLPQDRQPDWSGYAVDHGYYDQSHLARDVRQFAGCTPRVLWERRRESLAGRSSNTG